MIIKKPYAFLIKYFRLIHFAILSVMIYVFIKFSNILSFFNKYVVKGYSSINKENLVGLLSFWLFVFSILIIIALFIIFLLLNNKKKPKNFYALTIIYYVLLLLLLLYTNGQIILIRDVGIKLITVRFIRDIYLIITFIQPIFIIIISIKVIGFDIKKFEFKKNAESLQIKEEDREELEVLIDFNKDNIIRFYNKSKREFIYYYKENKIILRTLLIVIMIIPIVIILSKPKELKNYKKNDVIKNNNSVFRIKHAIITKNDYKGKEIKKNHSYIVISFEIQNKLENFSLINTGNIRLESKGEKFYPIETNTTNFLDFGDIYINQRLPSNEKKDFILLFMMPDTTVADKIYLYNYNNLSKITFKPENIDHGDHKQLLMIGEKTELNDSILSSISIKIDNLILDSQIEYDYDFCVRKICQKKTEKVIAGNQRILIKISGSLAGEKNYYNFNNLSRFISYFGSISYEKNSKTINTSYLKDVTPKGILSKDLIFSTDKTEDYDAIYFNIKIRNKVYQYKIY